MIIAKRFQISVVLIMCVLILTYWHSFSSPSLGAVTPLIVPEKQLTKCAVTVISAISKLYHQPIAAVLYSQWKLENII